jgi:protease-4
MTDKERQMLQSIIDNAYGQFVDAIVRGRKMEREKLLPLADGRIFTGAQAKAEGLVDELGNLESAVALAAEMAGIKGKPRLIYEEDPWNKIFSILSQKSERTFWEQASSRFGVRFAYLWEYSL